MLKPLKVPREESTLPIKNQDMGTRCQTKCNDKKYNPAYAKNQTKTLRPLVRCSAAYAITNGNSNITKYN